MDERSNERCCMIEKFMQMIIAELGPTGLLVVGLYHLLHKPLCGIVSCVCEMQKDMKDMLRIVKDIYTEERYRS